MDTPESLPAIPARRLDMLGLAILKQHKAGQDNRLRVLLLQHRLRVLLLQHRLLVPPAPVIPARRPVGTAAAAAIPERPNPVKR